MRLSRRRLIRTFGTAAGTVLLQSCTAGVPSRRPFQLNPYTIIVDNPEVTTVRLGIIPSLEVAPLLVAQNKQIFAKYGMKNVELVPFKSWQNICDRTEIGTDLGNRNAGGKAGLDGGHFYSPCPELLNEGVINRYSRRLDMYVLMRLHTHGGYILASKRLNPLGMQIGRTTLSAWQDIARLFGKPMRAAIAEQGSNYDLWLRYWLAALDVTPKQNIDILTIPTEQMLTQVQQSRADLLCVDSWHTLKFAEAGVAEPAIAVADIWRNYPGEVLAMRADWVDKYPIATQALMQATMEAQIWCDDPANAQELNTIMAMSFKDIRSLISQPIKIFSELFKGIPNQKTGTLKVDKSNNPIRYWSNDGLSVSYPYKSHDLWFLNEYRRWQILPDNFEIKETIDAVNREDLWKKAAKAIGVPDTHIPETTSRGVETFFNGFQFDPNHIK
jgi:ABC-type nitrate/sulfonate/bicarbonate transport system substrate-binding protein